MKANKHLGSDFDEFLQEEGLLEEAESVAAKRVFVFQLEKELEKQKLNKQELAKKMGTSRSAIRFFRKLLFGKNMIDKFIPLILVTPNQKEHWRKIYSRNKSHHRRIKQMFLVANKKISLPCKVILTRYGMREFDYDNLVYSFKAIRDAISDQLIPGRAAGQADSDKRIQWDYKQQLGQKKGINIKIDLL